MPPPGTLGQISREGFKQGSHNYTAISGKISLTNPDMASLAASGQLQNAIEFCIKVRKMHPAGKESNNSVNVYHRITKFYVDFYSD